MKALWMTVAGLSTAAACVAPVDYGEATPDPGSDAAVDVDASLVFPACVGGGHDEDGDCVWDKFDLCPMVAESVQGGDRDLDGVGNACDPNDFVATRQFAFDAFDREDTSWISDGSATWDIRGDALTVDLLGGSGGTSREGGVISPIRVVAEIEVEARGEGAQVSMFVEYSPQHRRGSECYIISSRDGLTGQLGWTRVDDDRRDDFLSVVRDMPSPMLGAGQRFTLTFDHGLAYGDQDFTGTRCTYASGGRSVTVADDDVPARNGQLRFAARDVRLRVLWVVVYRVDPNAPITPSLPRTPRP